MLDTKGVEHFSFSWEEGRLFDFWSVVHFVGGMAIAFSSYAIGFGYVFSYVGTFVGMVIYEAVEEYAGVDETLENKILDIVYGMAGFVLVYEVFLPNLGAGGETVGLIVSLVFSLLGGFFGWSAYRKRIGKPRPTISRRRGDTV